MEAELQLQHEEPDKAQEELPVIMGSSPVNGCQPDGTSAAVEKAVGFPATLDKPSEPSGVRGRSPDLDLDDIHMMTDDSDDNDTQHNPFRRDAAITTKTMNLLAGADSQKQWPLAHTAVWPAQEQTDDDALQSDWALGDGDSGGIVFDDTAIDFTSAPGTQGGSEVQAVGQPEDSASAEAHAGQKRAREELRDKLIQVGAQSTSHSGAGKHLIRCGTFSGLAILLPPGSLQLGVMQELLEESGRSSRLEPLIAYMRDQLAAMPPDTSGLFPTSLSKLRQGCINAQVPGSEATQQRHMSALLTVVQRSNTGSSGAAILPLAGGWQLKLEPAHGSKDVRIRRVMCG